MAITTSRTVIEESREGIFTVQVPDTQALYQIYMPFIKNGGVFVETNKSYKLGEEVTINLRLLEETAMSRITGKIVWMNPKSVQGGRPAGVGVQMISDEAQEIARRIETYLAGMLNMDRETSTM